MRRAIFLDRDGTINAMVIDPDHGTVDSPATAEDFRLLPGVGDAIRRINEAGFLVAVVSNQPGIAKRRFTAYHLEALTRRMHEDLARLHARVDAVFYCLHHPEAAVEDLRVVCDCRKPRPGLLLEASRSLGVDLRRSYMVGDGIADIRAGAAAGCRTIWIGRRRCDVCQVMERDGVSPDYTAENLQAAVDLILDHEGLRPVSPPAHCAGGPLVATGDSVRPLGDSYISRYLDELKVIADRLDRDEIRRMVDALVALRQRGGRLFILGVGGGAGHASHAVCDFRKIAGLEAYTPADNVAELTARVNDEGWESVFVHWLRGSRLGPADMVLVFSVGGGDLDRNISPNLARALEYAREVGATICGVVGRDGGYTRKVADVCIVVPPVNPAVITPHTETFQAAIWHLLVSHPMLQEAPMKWESGR
jgi:D-sedoheptulose 7-phosphate isomerase